MAPPTEQPRIVDPAVKPVSGEKKPPVRADVTKQNDLLRDLLPQMEVPSVDDNGQKWKFSEQDYDSALQAAMDSGKPVVIKIGTKGCSGCDIMDEQAIPKNEALIQENAVFIKVDGLKAGELCKQLDATAWPVNFVGYVQKGSDGKPEFKPIARQDFMKPEEYSSFLRSALPIARSNMKKPPQPPKPQPQEQPFIRR